LHFEREVRYYQNYFRKGVEVIRLKARETNSNQSRQSRGKKKSITKNACLFNEAAIELCYLDEKIARIDNPKRISVREIVRRTEITGVRKRRKRR
jgi:hypothetical protein